MKVVLYQTAIADYRDKFIEECMILAASRSIDFSIRTGSVYFDGTTKTSDYISQLGCTKILRNFFFFNRRLLFQPINLVDFISADVVFCELNPRIINTWIILLLRKILFKKTVLWGHAWPRSGKESKSEIVRSILKDLASSLLVYTNSQKKELISKGANCPIYVAPNALYKKTECKNVYSSASMSIIYVGRLVAAKKVDLLIKGAATFLKKHPECSLEIVGSGTEDSYLKSLVESLNIKRQVNFHGHVADYAQLMTLYSKAFVSVSPGYVGLSITQSFSFGIPMLVSMNENHSPEIEALMPGLNGDFFETDKLSSLAGKIEECYKKKPDIVELSNDIVSDCARRYSVEIMAEGFYESL